MSIDAAIDLLRSTTGGIYQFPNGITDITESITLDYRDAASDIHTDPRNVAIRGERMGTTVLRNCTNGPSITITGDDAAGGGWGAIAYEGVEDLTIAAQTPNTGTGIKLVETAFGNFKNLMFRDLAVGMDCVSALSARFERIYATGGVDAVRISKGAGFSDHNANKYVSCDFRLGTGVAVKGGPCSGIWFDDLTIQGWGTHGNANCGGMDLTFTGNEGSVGLELSGGYFEQNAGGFDIRLTNVGTRMVTHVISATTFNRIRMDTLVSANIVLAGGPQTLVLIGCAFPAMNDYVPSASRPLFSYTPGVHRIIEIGCDLNDPIERNGVGGSGAAQTGEQFAFRVSALGAFTGPAGWLVTRLSPGVTRIIHNLNLPANGYGFQATVTDANSGVILHTFPQANWVDVVTGMNFTTPADRGVSGLISIF